MHFFAVLYLDINAVLEFHFGERCAVHDVISYNYCSVCAHLFFSEVVAGEWEFDFFLGAFAWRVVAEDSAEDEAVVFGGDFWRECLGGFGVEDACLDVCDVVFVDAFFGRGRYFFERGAVRVRNEQVFCADD